MKERGKFEALVVEGGIIYLKPLKKKDWIVGGREGVWIAFF